MACSWYRILPLRGLHVGLTWWCMIRHNRGFHAPLVIHHLEAKSCTLTVHTRPGRSRATASQVDGFSATDKNWLWDPRRRGGASEREAITPELMAQSENQLRLLQNSSFFHHLEIQSWVTRDIPRCLYYTAWLHRALKSLTAWSNQNRQGQ